MQRGNVYISHLISYFITAKQTLEYMEVWGHPEIEESFFLPETLHWTVNCKCPGSLSMSVSIPDIHLTPRKEQPRIVCLRVSSTPVVIWKEASSASSEAARGCRLCGASGISVLLFIWALLEWQVESCLAAELWQAYSRYYSPYRFVRTSD